jgi:putative FmdB family regulatory protein
MPIYEYVCGKCGKKTEVIQRVGEALLRVCPHCGGRLKKAFSAPAIQFKGSGWYITDYARAKSETGGSAKADSESGEKTGDKTDKSEKTEKAGKGDGEKAGKSEKPPAKTDKKKS